MFSNFLHCSRVILAWAEWNSIFFILGKAQPRQNCFWSLFSKTSLLIHAGLFKATYPDLLFALSWFSRDSNLVRTHKSTSYELGPLCFKISFQLLNRWGVIFFVIFGYINLGTLLTTSLVFCDRSQSTNTASSMNKVSTTILKNIFLSNWKLSSEGKASNSKH